MAVNCSIEPFVMLGFVGVIPMETSVAGVMVKRVVADIPPDVAMIVADPVPTGVASPLEPAALLMAAAVVADELHVAEFVRFCVDPSE